jgi:hypothetical protein
MRQRAPLWRMHGGEVSSAPRVESAANVMDGERRTRYLVIFLAAAPGAVICWFVFHAVYADLTVSAAAVGYVDALTQAGITFGYVVMIGGTIALAAVAVWALYRYIRVILR